MSNTAGPPTPAGWFRDPGGTDQLRWWDGTAWTGHLTPMPPAASPQPTPQPTPHPTPTVLATPTFTPIATATPATEADPTERPYVPFQNSWNSTGYAAQPGDFARPMQWNTGGVWVLATSTLWSSIVAGALVFVYFLLFGTNQLISVSTGTTATSTALELELGIGAIGILLLLFAASRDRARLRSFGYLQLTSVWWVLLVAPLVYLIIRTIRVRRESGHGLAPLVFYLVSYVGIIVLGIVAAVAIPAFLASRVAASSTVADTANATSLASGITSGMDKNGGNYSVSCTPFAEPKTNPVDVTCTALDIASNVSHTLQIEVDPGVDGGQPTVKLLSVTPPISQ
jgi:hypothetical protein